jgi:hypothetical protein
MSAFGVFEMSKETSASGAIDLISDKKPKRHPAFGLMKDVTWVAPGVDLTEPAFPEWADFIEEKYGKDAQNAQSA